MVETPLRVEQDTWIVAFVRGTPDTAGFRPLFPYLPRSYVKEGDELKWSEPLSLEAISGEPGFGVPAWALTNPIFIDVDGDANGDGEIFEAIYVKQGIAPALVREPPASQAGVGRRR
ncbi:MAG: hypothetical protein HYV03_08390 [Deltaproteobacteria bacterium]|nr:hypothetical protein [Deltaproteobacteria bacterium]